MLELKNVSASYGEVRALRNLTLEIAAGETLALIGRNGAGKTTTLRVLAGVLEPVHGDVRWNGESLLGKTPEERVGMGIALVPEGRGMFPGLTVEENLKMGAYCRRPRRRELRGDLAEVYELLPRLGERKGQAAGSLSGGEQQMLAIGRALLSKPRLLLLDEPSLGLSPIMIQALYELLEQLKDRQTSFILVEQFVPLALKLCDRAVGLKKGAVALTGSAADVAHEELTDVYMGGADLESAARSVVGVD